MHMLLPRSVLLSVVLASCATPARGQTFQAVGTRAAGMGGAHVAAVNDASAAYWNPAGFASGAYFSLVVDWTEASRTPPEAPGAARETGLLFAIGAPAFGVSYYRLNETALRVQTPVAGATSPAREVRIATLATQNLGSTLVQSLFPGVAVGATLRYVRGRAGAEVRLDGDRDELLEEGVPLADDSDREFDLDIGVMASGGGLKVGLTVRNVLEPDFDIPSEGGRVQLQRQARAGVAVTPGIFTIAADFDLLETDGPFGEVRDIALGGEARLGGRAFLRSGLRVNTLSDAGFARTPSYSVGGSVAIMRSLLIDAQFTTGTDQAAKGWGVAGRFVY